MTDDADDDDYPRVYADIRILRRWKGIPPTAAAVWQTVKGLGFAACGVVALATLLGAFEPSLQLAIFTAFMLCWATWEHVFARHRPGTSHVLVTERGILFTSENVYLRWEEIAQWGGDQKLVRVRPKPGAGRGGWFAPSEYLVPLNDDCRTTVRGCLTERVGPPRG